jgi:hypothetical protein
VDRRTDRKLWSVILCENLCEKIIPKSAKRYKISKDVENPGLIISVGYVI